MTRRSLSGVRCCRGRYFSGLILIWQQPQQLQEVLPNLRLLVKKRNACTVWNNLIITSSFLSLLNLTNRQATKPHHFIRSHSAFNNIYTSDARETRFLFQQISVTYVQYMSASLILSVTYLLTTVTIVCKCTLG